MNSKRENSIILYTDIADFTKLINQDEELAIEKRISYCDILDEKSPKYGGEVIRHRDNSSIIKFNNSVRATQCAITLQKKFQKESIPVRIGIHQGELIISGNEVLGNSISITRQIEKLGKAGSICISSPLYDQLIDNKNFNLSTLGYYMFDDCTRPIEIFAICNSDIVVPDPEKNIFARSKRVSMDTFREIAVKESLEQNIFRSLWKKGVPQLIAGYFIAVWTILQFLDWILTRYQISPYWTDLCLILFSSMLPSVFLYVYDRERINRGKVSLFAKIAFPSNALVTILLIIFMFNSVDLGAMTKTVNVKNENGVTIEKTIFKEVFQSRIMLFPFKNSGTDSTYNWLKEGIPIILDEDLYQLNYLYPTYSTRTTSLSEQIKQANQTNHKYFLTGLFDKANDKYIITTQLFKTKNGSLQKEHIFQGDNLFELLDSITKQISVDIEIPQSTIDKVVDLPIAQHMTDNINALRFYCEGIHSTNAIKLVESTKLDSTFALANTIFAELCLFYQISENTTKKHIDLAMRHKNRQSECNKITTRALNYWIYNDKDKSIALLELQREFAPNNTQILNLLSREYSTMYPIKDIEKQIEITKKLFDLHPQSPYYFNKYVRSFLYSTTLKKGIILGKELLVNHPEYQQGYQTLGELYLLTKNYVEAEKLFKKAQLLDPDNEDINSKILKGVSFLKNKNTIKNNLSTFIGKYRSEDGPIETEIFIHNNHLIDKAKNQPYFYLFPTSNNKFTDASGHISGSFVKKSLHDKFPYKYVIKQSNLADSSTYWREDSLIQNANNLFKTKNYKAALLAYEKARKSNPNHFYLNYFIDHIKCKNKTTNNKYIGAYDNYTITEKDSNLYLSNDLVKFNILYTSDTTFFIPMDLDKTFTFKYKNKKIIGIEQVNNKGEVKFLKKK